jgi:tetratricopeptide (TPR) repeat protein
MMRKRGNFILILVGLLSLTLGAAPADDRAEAIRLCNEHRDAEAIPLLEKLHKANPDDREIKERLACALAIGGSLLEGDKQVATMLRARKMLEELNATGKLRYLGTAFLEMIPPDGKFKPETAQKDVAEAMKRGERAFAKHDFAKARADYELALALDPKLYQAAVFAGDAWFAEGKMDEAIAWFAKAARMEPDQALAYRYWGDALTRQGKMREARDPFFAGIVAEPYTRRPWLSLGQWGEANDIKLGHPRVMPPEPLEENVEDGTTSLAVYRKTREAWKAKLFKAKHPEEPTYRHSLDEESAALLALAEDVDKAIKSGKITQLNPGLANLIELKQAGLIEPFILFAGADEGISKDYPGYREKHRDKLLDYLGRFVAPFPEAKEVPKADEHP